MYLWNQKRPLYQMSHNHLGNQVRIYFPDTN